MYLKDCESCQMHESILVQGIFEKNHEQISFFFIFLVFFSVFFLKITQFKYNINTSQQKKVKVSNVDRVMGRTHRLRVGLRCSAQTLNLKTKMHRFRCNIKAKFFLYFFFIFCFFTLSIPFCSLQENMNTDGVLPSAQNLVKNHQVDRREPPPSLLSMVVQNLQTSKNNLPSHLKPNSRSIY